MLDFDLATKTTASERAISNFMLDTHTKTNGYTEVSPPLMASAETMFGTGQLPKFETDQFEIKFDDSKEQFGYVFVKHLKIISFEKKSNIHLA